MPPVTLNHAGQWRVSGGREKQSSQALKGGFDQDLSITTEVISGSHLILLGKLAARTAQIGASYMPVVVYMALNSQKKIQEMTIATF